MNMEAVKIWISERAAAYLFKIAAAERMSTDTALQTSALMDACLLRAIGDYRDIVENLIKEKTGQLTTKDVAHYEQTRPSA